MNTTCGVCGTEYNGMPFGGYCDETLDCIDADLLNVTPL